MDEEKLISEMLIDDFTPFTHALEEEENERGQRDELRTQADQVG